MIDVSFSLFIGLGDARMSVEGTRLKVGVDNTSVELELELWLGLAVGEGSLIALKLME